ncbi:hypothetical protein D4764_14G0006840 [Takifugu flavidus]|uniref:Uncharacterized protein n=1 Tax=Takifugu flavidus TaxID=433684 RepID=A0A5C6P782_9TELE|nr:hypothetical protein D4764_14G0006840 [Takifugu flavidus]
MKDLAPSEKASAKRRQQKRGTNGQTTGLAAGKQTPALDSPPENFVICPQGVCSFFWRAGERPRHEEKKMSKGGRNGGRDKCR